jgi:hypothetical protein
MLVQDLIRLLNLQVKSMSREGSLRHVGGGFVGDVLSHVMAKTSPGFAWITVQTHENVVAVASLLDVSCVIVCQRELSEETCQRAKAEGITLLWSGDSAFDVAGRLYSALNPADVQASQM